MLSLQEEYSAGSPFGELPSIKRAAHPLLESESRSRPLAPIRIICEVLPQLLSAPRGWLRLPRNCHRPPPPAAPLGLLPRVLIPAATPINSPHSDLHLGGSFPEHPAHSTASPASDGPPLPAEVAPCQPILSPSWYFFSTSASQPP